MEDVGNDTGAFVGMLLGASMVGFGEAAERFLARWKKCPFW